RGFRFGRGVVVAWRGNIVGASGRGGDFGDGGSGIGGGGRGDRYFRGSDRLADVGGGAGFADPGGNGEFDGGGKSRGFLPLPGERRELVGGAGREREDFAERTFGRSDGGGFGAVDLRRIFAGKRGAGGFVA